ncbi:hypothetical protein HHK36_028763 [Tetracentron sinense]|uniref:Clp R domain-containing protein n=1 Tax=Tetracentron sinense TaxID=13715 RepID=A0A834YGT8_TETSI|nr:hypothetical protein HHK36_028763 [Tetracentron sinense]
MAARTLSVLPISTAASQSDCRKHIQSSFSNQWCLRPEGLVNSLFWNELSLRSSNLRPLVRKHRTPITTVLFSLPTAKPESASAEKIPKWSSRGIKSFAMGELEARKLKYPNTGTEALLMGILIEGTSLAAKFLRANGVTLFKVREETVKLLGKADMYFFSPEHPPLTEPAQRALDWAVNEKLKSGGSGEITTTHLLLGIWSEEESAGHKIMAAFGFDDEKAKELVTSVVCSEPGFLYILDLLPDASMSRLETLNSVILFCKVFDGIQFAICHLQWKKEPYLQLNSSLDFFTVTGISLGNEGIMTEDVWNKKE